jgi:hypothetical protein
MTKRQFIKEHKTELCEAINNKMGMDIYTNVSNAEIEMWLLNDEGLYNWARSEGVRI